MKRIGIILLLLISMIMLGCIETPNGDDDNNTTINNTSNQTTGRLIGIGDTISVDYVLRDYNDPNKTIIDTSLAYYANLSGTYNEARDYSPLTLEVRDNNGFITGFTFGMIGLENGSHETIIIAPEDGYGVKDDELVGTQLRIYDFPKYQNMSKSYAEDYNMTFELNQTFKDNGWNVTVVNESETKWLLYHQPQIGMKFINGGITQEIINLTDITATVKVMVEEGDKYMLNNPKNQQRGVATVILVNETHVVFDWNDEMKGKTLEFEIWIRNIES